jgi:hypothetical protein
MSEATSMCQSRWLLGKAQGDRVFPLSCRLMYCNFFYGSRKPRQPVGASLKGSSPNVHLDRPPYCLISTLSTMFNTHRSKLGAAF